MIKKAYSLTLAAFALAASLLLVACGGGEDSASASPTVVITSELASNGQDVIFTFTFSDDVGATFTAEDVAITGGTMVSNGFNKVGNSNTIWTMQIQPTTDPDKVRVSVASGKFSAVARTSNTSAVSARMHSRVITFESDDTSGFTLGGLADFGGNISSLATSCIPKSQEVGCGGGSGSYYESQAAKVIKGSETWAGTTFLKLSNSEFISPTSQTVSVKVYTPNAGVTVRLKLEVDGDPSKFLEMDQVAKVQGWNNLVFDATKATTAVNHANLYNVASIFFDFGHPGNGETYYFDNFSFTPPVVVTFEQGDNSGYSLGGTADFGGAVSSLATSGIPTGGMGTQAAKVIKASGAQIWAGTTFLTIANAEFISAASPVVELMVHAPKSTLVKLKLEQEGDATKFVELDATTTADGWSKLTFDASKAALNHAIVFNKASVFFKFGAEGTGDTYYFDNFTYAPSPATTYVPSTISAPSSALQPSPLNAQNVLSIYSDSFTNVAGTNFSPWWWQATQYQEIQIGANHVVSYTSLNYEGIELAGVTDVSSFNYLHVDVFTDCTQLDLKLINSRPWPTPSIEKAFTIAGATKSAWKSVNIPLSSYSDVVDLVTVDQLSFTCNSPQSNANLYFDNLYFWK